MNHSIDKLIMDNFNDITDLAPEIIYQKAKKYEAKK